MKNWKKIIEASGLNIPDPDRIVPWMDALESSFRPLVKTIPHDVEPAMIFRAATEVPEEPR